MKQILYYTNNWLPTPIMSAVQKQILKSGLPIVSVSLRPIDFGENIVVDANPSVITMFNQIYAGLQATEEDFIFLCEHDVLYHPCHFDFLPIMEDVYYYNTNVWRWDYPKDRLITYDNLISLSGLCASRELLLQHYRRRLRVITERGYKADSRDPGWARVMGYEPGKKIRRGGFADEEIVPWQSDYPNIDIRHKRTITPPKVTLDSFKHQPTGWRERTWKEIEGWNYGLEGSYSEEKICQIVPR